MINWGYSIRSGVVAVHTSAIEGRADSDETEDNVELEFNSRGDSGSGSGRERGL